MYSDEINIPQEEEDYSIRKPHKGISLADPHLFSQLSSNLSVMTIDIENYHKDVEIMYQKGHG
jgi:hypothetical protein